MPAPPELLMTPFQKNLIRITWAQVVPIADQAAASFYQRLFEIDPSARGLFRETDMAQQRKKLIQVLGVAVSSLDNLGALIRTLDDLGRRHAGYGVHDRHYDTVGAALLWTLEKGLGDTWNAQVAAAWTEAYSLLAGVMRRAMQEAVARTAA
jgi:hemoglobin-like flavoprotein